MLTRRGFAKLSFVSLIAMRCDRVAAAEGNLGTLDAAIVKIEADVGGRLGVAVLDTGSGVLAGHRIDAKLRAGLPKSWRVGDKTGSGNHGSSNDVAVIWPEGKPPVIVASYLTETNAPDDKRNAAHAAVGRTVAAVLAT